MQNTFLVYSVNDSGKEILEHECVSFDDAVKEVDGYLCKTRIYAKVPLTEYGERRRDPNDYGPYGDL